MFQGILKDLYFDNKLLRTLLSEAHTLFLSGMLEGINATYKKEYFQSSD